MKTPEYPNWLEECDSMWDAYQGGWADGYRQACKDVKTEQLDLLTEREK